MRRLRLLAILYCALFFSGTPHRSFHEIRRNFIAGYTALNIPGVTYDYREYFNAIPDEASLERQKHFFAAQQDVLQKTKRDQLGTKEKVDYDLLVYETAFNLQRLALEQRWVRSGRKIPSGGLHELERYGDWYRYFIKKFTSTDTTPEDVFALGEAEVKRVKVEMNKIRTSLGFNSMEGFYKHLEHDSFYIRDKNAVIAGFKKIDTKVRKHLFQFAGISSVPDVYAMEWTGADANTPPGIYLGHNNTAYGKDVFQFNFYNSRYNRRAMEWLYMHEAIPGHHLQSSIRQPDNLHDLFLYPGNFEGWACYVEYFGSDVGLYDDPYSYFGKWEWDLVRSARLVLDAGIHYYGWDRAKALQYWKETVPGQDYIADREITRVTNWCAQALSYKVGADFIMRLREEWITKHPQDSVRNFHYNYLKTGVVPLTVFKQNLS